MQEVRRQGREDARRMVVHPKGPRAFIWRESYKPLPKRSDEKQFVINNEFGDPSISLPRSYFCDP